MQVMKISSEDRLHLKTIFTSGEFALKIKKKMRLLKVRN